MKKCLLALSISLLSTSVVGQLRLQRWSSWHSHTSGRWILGRLIQWCRTRLQIYWAWRRFFKRTGNRRLFSFRRLKWFCRRMDLRRCIGNIFVGRILYWTRYICWFWRLFKYATAISSRVLKDVLKRYNNSLNSLTSFAGRIYAGRLRHNALRACARYWKVKTNDRFRS